MITNSPQIHIIVQARTGSTRLPNKVMKYLEDKIVLEHVIDRLSLSKYGSKVIISTTRKVNDNVIIEHCHQRKTEIFSGSEKDVLNRYYETATYYKSDIIIRVTSDCPLIDVQYIDMMIEYYLKNNLDYLGPKYFGNHKFPDGFNGEIFSYKVNEFNYPIDYHLYKNIDFSTLHLSLDTKEDYLLIQDIFKHVYLTKNHFKLEDVLTFINKN